MTERDKQRYYWLKLKKDFFQQHQIKVLKSLPNGRLYALIYLELLAESTSHEGELRYSKMLPYDTVTLAAVIDEDKDNVEKAIETLINLELIEMLDDGTIYMREVQKLLGSETGSAVRKREYRERLGTIEEVPQIESGTLSQNCPIEIRDKSIENREYKRIFNTTLNSTLPIKDTCAEQSANDCSPPQKSKVKYKIPIKDKKQKFHPVTEEDIQHYQEFYPELDVDLQVRKMVMWCESNPTRIKTKTGVKSFITGWLNREQNKLARVTEQKKNGVTYFDIE